MKLPSKLGEHEFQMRCMSCILAAIPASNYPCISCRDENPHPNWEPDPKQGLAIYGIESKPSSD